MFKVGDRVRVVQILCGADQETLGEDGIIISHDPNANDYQVRFSNLKTWYYQAREIEHFNDKNADAPTLLDQFAMHALTGMMALSVKTDGDFHTDVVVRRCWDVANEMMKAREAQK